MGELALQLWWDLKTVSGSEQSALVVGGVLAALAWTAAKVLGVGVTALSRWVDHRLPGTQELLGALSGRLADANHTNEVLERRLDEIESKCETELARYSLEAERLKREIFQLRMMVLANRGSPPEWRRDDDDT